MSEPITKGLREYIERHPTMMHAVGLTDLCDNIDAINRSLEQENERLRETKSLLGPTDVDGVPINVGDMLAEGEASPERVKALMFDRDGWSVNFGLGWCIMKYHKWHHVKPDTWASIINDAIVLGVEQEEGKVGLDSYSEQCEALVARCKALCEHTREGEE